MNTQTENDRMTLAQFIDAHGLTITATRIAARTDGNGDAWDSTARHWICTLSRGGMGTGKGPKMAEMTVQFSQGSAHTKAPTCEDVLDCLVSDAAGVIDAGLRFEDWCAEYGCDEDSRSAERTFNACKAQAQELERFIGGDEAFKTLLWNTERL